MRRATFTSSTWADDAWSAATTKTSHYTSDSDEPSWISEDTTNPTAVTRYVGGVEGDAAITTSLTGNRELQLVDLHGDIVATLPISDGDTSANWANLAFTSFDEFGVAQPMTGSGATTGPLLQIDSIPDRSANAHDYRRNTHSVNCYDLDGEKPWWKTALTVVAAVADVASAFVPGPIGAAIGEVAVGACLVTGDKDSARVAAIGAAATLVGASLIAGAAKLARVAKSIATAGRLAARLAPKIARASKITTGQSRR